MFARELEFRVGFSLSLIHVKGSETAPVCSHQSTQGLLLSRRRRSLARLAQRRRRSATRRGPLGGAVGLIDCGGGRSPSQGGEWAGPTWSRRLYINLDRMTQLVSEINL